MGRGFGLFAIGVVGAFSVAQTPVPSGQMRLEGEIQKVDAASFELLVKDAYFAKGEMHLGKPIVQLITYDSRLTVAPLGGRARLVKRGDLRQGMKITVVALGSTVTLEDPAPAISVALSSPSYVAPVSRAAKRAPRHAPTPGGRIEYDGVCMDAVSVQMIFPVLTGAKWSDTFLAPRDGGARRHHGQDLMAKKHTPLVAAFDGIVYPREGHGTAGYSITLVGDNGWNATYMHVNIDTPGTRDGKGLDEYAFAPGATPGARVVAGQLIGYVGDSGNARGGAAHCHFELSGPDGAVYNAAGSLRESEVIQSPTPAFSDIPQPQAGEERLEGYVSKWDPSRNVLIVALAQTTKAGRTKVATQPASEYLRCEGDQAALAAGLPVGVPISAVVQPGEGAHGPKVLALTSLAPPAPAAPNASATLPVPPPEAAKAPLAKSEIDLLVGLNDARADAGLHPVAENGVLDGVAEEMLGATRDDPTELANRGLTRRGLLASGLRAWVFDDATMGSLQVRNSFSSAFARSPEWKLVGLLHKEGRWAIITAAAITRNPDVSGGS